MYTWCGVVLVLLCSGTLQAAREGRREGSPQVHSGDCTSHCCPDVTLQSHDSRQLHHISPGQDVTITYTIHSQSNLIFSPMWSVQSFEHEPNFILQSADTASGEKHSHFQGNGITAHAVSVHKNVSNVDCTLTLSTQGEGETHLVVLFWAQAEAGCKVQAPTPTLIEVAMSRPHPPPTPVITSPPKMSATTETTDHDTVQDSNTALGSNRLEVILAVCLCAFSLLLGACAGALITGIICSSNRWGSGRGKKLTGDTGKLMGDAGELTTI